MATFQVRSRTLTLPHLHDRHALLKLLVCSAPHCIARDRNIPTRPCIVCSRPVHDLCDAGSKFEPERVADLYHCESHHMACSRTCLDAELANRFRNSGIFVSNQDPSVSNNSDVPAPLLTPIDESEDPVKAPVSDSSAASGLVFTISDFVKIEHGADVLNIDQPAQAARLIGPAHVETIRAMVRESGWVSELSAFSVAEKNLSSDRRVQLPPLVHGKLAVPLYLIDGFHRRAMSQIVDDSEIDLAGFAKNAVVHLWAKKGRRHHDEKADGLHLACLE